MQDRDTQRVYRLRDFTKAQLIPPEQAYCDAGNVNSAGRLNLVIESARLDTKHNRGSTDRAHADGAGGLTKAVLLKAALRWRGDRRTPKFRANRHAQFRMQD